MFQRKAMISYDQQIRSIEIRDANPELDGICNQAALDSIARSL